MNCSRFSQLPTRVMKCFGLLWGLDWGQFSLKGVWHTKVIIINKHLVTANHMPNAEMKPSPSLFLFLFLVNVSHQVKESIAQLPVIPEEAIS